MRRSTTPKGSKNLSLVPTDALIEDNDEVQESISQDRYERAGAMLKGMMERQYPSIGKWASVHGFADTTVRQICNGRYNVPVGMSLDLMWRLSLALAENDKRAAQRVCFEYCATLGIVPIAREVSIVTELAAVEAQVRRIADKVAVWR